MKTDGLTIGRLAADAGVGIETIRYYQRRALLPEPEPTPGSAFRKYPRGLVNRIRFIKRAQELGFTLDEVATLLQLEDGTNRRAIRRVAGARLEQIRERVADLQQMEKALSHLIHRCEQTDQAHSCPIIDALLGNVPPATGSVSRIRKLEPNSPERPLTKSRAVRI
jgi:MerR family transcriptional regulator, mercuric resistance operon regulatory protein